VVELNVSVRVGDPEFDPSLFPFFEDGPPLQIRREYPSRVKGECSNFRLCAACVKGDYEKNVCGLRLPV
jgi:hypothetical protein